MIEEAKKYLASRTIARQEPLYSANRAARLIGDIPLKALTTEKLSELRRRMLADGLRPRTVESTISDLLTVMQAEAGTTVERGVRLKQDRPQPSPVEISAIETIWPLSHEFLQTYMAFSYWTGLRMTDAMQALREHKAKPLPDVLRWTASKTGKHHVFPIPPWLRTIVQAGPYRFRSVSDFAKRWIRSELQSVCEAASLEVIHPKQFRQRAVTEWSVANASAGAFIHGSGLKVMNHYCDPLSLIEAAAPRVRLPVCFGATIDRKDSLLQSFDRLDEHAKQIVLMTAERLAGAT